MKPNNRRAGMTIMEMVVTVAIVTFLMGYAWKIYFGGRETVRHLGAQSQMQSETRWFFDRLARDIAGAYKFVEIDTGQKKFSFYSYQTSRRTLEDMYYKADGKAIKPIDWVMDVNLIEYSLVAGGKVKRKQIPGFLAFIKRPMLFTKGPAAQYTGTPNVESEGTSLSDIVDFEVVGYEQIITKKANTDEVTVSARKVDGVNPADAAKACFIVLRIHNKIDEQGDRRDEELDLVCKFFSRVRCAEAAHPGTFCSTDEDNLY
ncbi:MAG: hypothetical protein HQM10_18015 [Candidatus Riflebacteria bacterium]|nr:hypothetical protein [Candidatus Riflebacteria bacterium]